MLFLKIQIFNMSINKFYILLAGCFFLCNLNITSACTNFLITKGATTDGSCMISYAADSHTLYGALHYSPAKDYPQNAMREVYDWDSNKFMGEIPQVPHTYSVVGNINEFQVAIGETTFGGRKKIQSQKDAIMDYGSLMYIALERSKTAREAIKVMTSLVEEYGYASEGESFSISDPNEVWIMEMIGKGNNNKGAVWVARKIPDGYVCGHANQARITTFPLNDSDNCLYAKDIITFAEEMNWFDGKNKDFSFSDIYAPVNFEGARFCDARVWAGFRKIASGMDKYLSYIEGNVKFGGKYNFATNRLPLWVKPDKKLSLKDAFRLMRDHFEGTPLDMTKDPGAGPFKLPYRWRGLTWEIDSTTYINERAVSTQQTGFSFITQSRSWLSNPVGGILWFGVDDTFSTCYAPMYCGIKSVPECFAEGNGDLLTYSSTSAFWTFNKVANFAYLRYEDMIVPIKKLQSQLENKFISYVPFIDEAAESLLKKDPQKAREFLTEFSINEANNMTLKWGKLYEFLLVKYIDGNIKKGKDGKFSRTKDGISVYPDQPGYPEWWYRAIVKSTGEHLKEIIN